MPVEPSVIGYYLYMMPIALLILGGNPSCVLAESRLADTCLACSYGCPQPLTFKCAGRFPMYQQTGVL